MPAFNYRLLVVFLLLVMSETRAQTARPDESLSRALRLADFYNWSDAQPLFEQAEQEFARLGDSRNALYAKLGRIRSTMEQISLPAASEMLATELDDNPILQSDRQLRLFCLTVKGDIDGELDSAPMRRDWEEAADIARQLGDRKSENRASGELGFAAFLDGDLASAQQMVAGALIAATLSQDVGAQIRYQAAIGTVFAMTGSFEQALNYLDRAAAVAQRNPDAGYQFLVNTGKLTALRGLQRFDAAEKLTDEMLAEARARKKYIKEAQVLISGSGTSVARKLYPQAIERLQAAVALTKERQVNRLLADAQFELASVYRATGDLKQAEQLALARGKLGFTKQRRNLRTAEAVTISSTDRGEPGQVR